MKSRVAASFACSLLLALCACRTPMPEPVGGCPCTNVCQCVHNSGIDPVQPNVYTNGNILPTPPVVYSPE
mgnify:CR=1 FL=1